MFIYYLDVLELEHVSLYECVLYLLICPCDEQFVEVCRSLREAHTEVDRHGEIHAIPIRFKQYTQFLCTSQGKDWDQNLLKQKCDLFSAVQFS